MLSTNVSLVATGIGLVAAAGVYLVLVVTLTTARQWWPPGDRSWAYYLHWSLVSVFNVSLLVVAVTDWGEWMLPSPASLVVGGALAVLGTGIFVHSARVMRSDEVAGVTGDLYTDGPYAYSRNPQYVGMLVGLAGVALVANSLLVTVLVTAHAGWILLLPRAAPLRAQYGRAYARYETDVPRFVSWGTIRRLSRTAA